MKTIHQPGFMPAAMNSGCTGKSENDLRRGELCLDDSLQHRHLSDELVSVEEKADILALMDIPFLRTPVEQQLSRH